MYVSASVWGVATALPVVEPRIQCHYFPDTPRMCLKRNALYYLTFQFEVPIPMAARSKAWVYGRSLAEIVGSNHAKGMGIFLLWVLCGAR